jgi:hypothetical protein
MDIDLDARIQPNDFSCEVEQTEHRLAILFCFYAFDGPEYCSKFMMWDLITQEQVAVCLFQVIHEHPLIPRVWFQNVASWEYRSFVFLDHRWILFGAIRNGPDAVRQYQPYLEISDPTNPTEATTLELDENALKDISSHFIVDTDFRVRSGAGHEEGSPAGDGGIPFVPDTSRGIITADLHLFHRNHHPQHDGLPRFESYLFVMDIEGMLTKVPSPSNSEQRCIEWKDLCSSAATFHYSSLDEDQYRLFSRESYASGFRYVSPIRPLLGNPDGPRCFFVYDFNPCREASDFLPVSAPEDPGSGASYPQSAREITRGAVGLGFWRMRFDLPAADENIKRCHISLTDGGVVLFEVCWLMTYSLGRFDVYTHFSQVNALGEECITVFSMW